MDAIKRELTAEEFESASGDDQSLYSKTDEGKYVFVGENAGELSRAKTRVAAERDKLARERDEALKQLAELKEAGQAKADEREVKTADAKAIHEKWQTRHAKELGERDQQIKGLQQLILSSKRDQIINDLANELALPETVELFKPFLRERIEMQFDKTTGQPTPVVYDSDRQVTADTIQDLTKEIKKDKRYHKFLKGAEVGSGATKPKTPDVNAKIGDPAKPSTGFGGGLKQPIKDASGFLTSKDPAEMQRFLESMGGIQG